MQNKDYSGERLWSVFKELTGRPHIDRDTYISCLLSVINDNNVVFNSANEDLIDILMKEIFNKFGR